MTVCMTWERDGRLYRVKVSVSDAGLSWSYDDELRHTNEIPIHQILKPRILSEEESTQVVVQYVKVVVPKKNKVHLQCAEIIFLGSYNNCVALKSQIEELIETKEPYRPKRVLLFINPKSGYGRSVRDYERIVSPLMERCGVEVDVIVTKSVTHAPEVIEKYDLSTVDAVLSMGGDGSAYHISNALILRTMKEAGAKYDDPDTPPIKPLIPLGAIPSGSGCALAMLATGAPMEVETAVIAIILGRTKPFSTMGVTHAGGRLSFMNLVGGCGVVTNTALNMEKTFSFPVGEGAGKTYACADLNMQYFPRKAALQTVNYPEIHIRTNKMLSQTQAQTTRPVGDCAINHPDLVETDGPWPGWETVRCKASDVRRYKTTCKFRKSSFDF